MTLIRVALIEDHDLTRAGLRTMLSFQAGVEVVGEAANGLDGLTLLLETPIDVALVDIEMPGLNGIEVTRRFKQWWSENHPEAAPPKVLMLTMQEDEAVVLAAFGAGADSYCMKDVSTTHLLEAVKSTYNGNHWIDPSIARIILKHNSQRQANQEATAAEPNSRAIAVDEEYTSALAAAPLTSRELDVIRLIVEGCSNAEIAARCYITVGTVKTHVRNILNKLCAEDRTQAAVRALRGGLVS
ncbi:response regulator transcription factor [Trichocoleus sp. FACHB-46]|uniref:Response regulator transcription factor n=2 Tax=Trichocoleus TaxID=450526 RepID=A0ABV0JG72_9CYAN|nr:response regulator transcription factor [Trichocoleus sp. FACHB-46]MBD1865594.1 response regulator transcription factor [Trichocoleus sp. FACHB-46]